MNYHDPQQDHDEEVATKSRIPRLWLLIAMILASWAIVVGVIYFGGEIFSHLSRLLAGG